MKKIIFSLCLLLIYSMGYSQNREVNSFFSGLEKSNDYAVVKVNKEMFQLLAAMDTGLQDDDVQDLISGLNGITILINDKGDDKNYSKFQNMVSSNKLTSYMSFRDEGNNVNLYSGGTTKDGKLEGVVLSVRDSAQTIYINVDGLVNIAALGKLTKDIEIDGLKQLKNLEKHRQ